MRITVVTAAVRPSVSRRQLAGTLVRYGEVGQTSEGPLRVRAGALRIPADLTRVPLTLEHSRDVVRGHLAIVDDNEERLYVVAQLVDGEAGDLALEDAASRARAAFSYDIEDAVVEGDEIVAGDLVAVGQVAEPAYNASRIDQIAASRPQTPGNEPGHQEENTMPMTEEQRARLAELRALTTMNAEERAELETLVVLEANEAAAAAEAQAAADAPAEPVTVAASRPAVPAGVPRPAARTQPQAGELHRFVETLSQAFGPNGGGARAVQAAFTDVTNTGNPTFNVPGWSGELWSGLQYQPQWSPLFSSGTLTDWKGTGWRFTTKPEMQDYTGDKAAVPSGPVGTESQDYTAARMAVGHDFDRKFVDFPDYGFIAAYLEAVRESWAIQLDGKVRAYVLAQAVAHPNIDPDTVATGVTGLLKAAALSALQVKKNTGAQATFTAVNGDDALLLLDATNASEPAYLKMFGVDPATFIVDDAIPAKTVISGVKNAATVRTLPGSPIRVSAQHLANGGIDEAFFGYWAIEEHHTSGIVKATFA